MIPLSGKAGRLFSPLYPQTYPPNMMCTWTITVPEGHFVKLRITSFFLEYTCRGSTLQIRDGQSESSSLLKSFCARKFESSVFSSGRHLWIRFQTPADKYSSGTGFSALFEAVNQCKTFFHRSRIFCFSFQCEIVFIFPELCGLLGQHKFTAGIWAV